MSVWFPPGPVCRGWQRLLRLALAFLPFEEKVRLSDEEMVKLLEREMARVDLTRGCLRAGARAAGAGKRVLSRTLRTGGGV